MSRARYSAFERRVARLLAAVPSLKSWLKRLYQRLNYVRHRKAYRHRSLYSFRPIGNDARESFFGYYDRSPESVLGQVLVHLSGGDTKEPPRTDTGIDIALFEANGAEACRVSVRAYNWQQGARALWAGPKQFLYNHFDEANGAYVSRLISAHDCTVLRSYDRPVQDVYLDSYFLSLNYRRLQALRPDYGYRNLPALTQAELGETGLDGIWRIEMNTGAVRLLYSLDDAIGLSAGREFSSGYHKFNHVMISPSGERFLMLHRRYINGRRDDRLLVGAADGSGMTLLMDTGMVSHCTWIGNEAVLGYMRDNEGREGYRIVDVHSGEMRLVARGALDEYGDGHPHANGDWFVTDTYPDKASMQTLLLCNWRSGEVRELGEFFHQLDYRGESRCDLHPRFSPDGKRVYFDSVFSGKRALYCMDLET